MPEHHPYCHYKEEGICTSGCPVLDICAYCGENKWINPFKHIGEIALFLQKEIEECQKIIHQGCSVKK